MALTQAGRHIRINTNLGKDKIFLESFEGEERVSDLFRFELALLTEDPNFSMDSLLNKPAVVSLILHDDTDRHFHGIINHIEEVETREEGVAVFRATMVPWAWLLTLFDDCRIFQNKSVPDIVQQVFKDRGFTDYTNRLTGTYQPREYCVQYRETDFNFISRLLEDEGIFYFFEHDQDTHTLVLADQPTAFVDCPCQSEAEYSTTAGLWQEQDVVLSASRAQRVRVGKITENDYDFEKPKTPIQADLDSNRKGEFYEYPGKYTVRDEGSRYARVRLEEQEVKLLTLNAETNCRAFRPGFKFKLTGYYQESANQEYAMLAIRHTAANNTYISADLQEAFDYRNTLECIPSSVPYHPPRNARRPFVQGTQTAVVVGKSGEEIWTDQYGRVKVQFFWDRAGQMDENSSCWIRVAQLWAGKGWGAIFTPRIGQEVIVDFLEGDPDRPIITGRVYNADQTVPYALPGEQTKSTIKSMTSKGGGGFNEIRLEDKAGSEQVFIFGQKDQDIRIKNDLKEWIGNDNHRIVVNNDYHQVKGEQHLQVTGDCNEKIGGSYSLNITSDHQQKTGMNYEHQAGTEIYLKAGMNMVLESGTMLTLKVGGNFINLNSGGVFISGSTVFINSGGAAGSGAGASPQSPTDPKEAATADPGQASSPPPPNVTPPASYGAQEVSALADTTGKAGSSGGGGAAGCGGSQDPSPMASVLQAAAQSGAPFCET
jgi:type VI secretion system secreted protein VgrG